MMDNIYVGSYVLGNIRFNQMIHDVTTVVMGDAVSALEHVENLVRKKYPPEDGYTVPHITVKQLDPVKIKEWLKEQGDSNE